MQISKKDSGTCNTFVEVVEPKLSLADGLPSLVSLQDEKYNMMM